MEENKWFPSTLSTKQVLISFLWSIEEAFTRVYYPEWLRECKITSVAR